ncbi:MAG TPA: hypothetical protein VGW38_28245, partial [Chloroflexota bacterium]|nr:hypothetical protein [Chloroflexota bacterium]
MAANAARVAVGNGGRRGSGVRRMGNTPEGPLAWLVTAPSWALRAAAVVAVLLLAILGSYLFYRGLDPLYPQSLWRYFRPAAAADAGTVLYRDLDGQLFLAPLGDTNRATRLYDRSLPAGQEIIRDAVGLPGGKAVA